MYSSFSTHLVRPIKAENPDNQVIIRVYSYPDPYLAYGVGGKTKIDGVSEKADTFGDDGLKRFDAGLGLGVAFEFGKIVVGVETGTSFTKVASGASAYNLSALATIGYKF